MERITRKITIEWESISTAIPDWLEKVVMDDRCISFESKTMVSKQKFAERVAKRRTELCEKGIPADEAAKLADAFVKIDYYVE